AWAWQHPCRLKKASRHKCRAITRRVGRRSVTLPARSRTQRRNRGWSRSRGFGAQPCPSAQRLLQQPFRGGAQCFAVLPLQGSETTAVVGALLVAQCLPGRVSGHVPGLLVKHVENGAVRILAEVSVVVVDQHLDANGALDGRQVPL